MLYGQEIETVTIDKIMIGVFSAASNFRTDQEAFHIRP